jgi:outer membrane protein OmpA-like peptidoglycan-associated protein/tetratricopeptide (TPR) repeat protein
MTASELIKSAEEFIHIGKFEAARKELKGAVRAKKNFAAAYRLLGFIDNELGYYKEAAEAFEKSFELNPALSRAAYYECGIAFTKIGEYAKAKEYLEHFKSMKNARYSTAEREDLIEEKYMQKVDKDILNCDFALAYKENEITENLQNLGNEINSSYDDYMPALSSDDKALVFTSFRTNSLWGGISSENILISFRKAGKKEEWSNAHNLSSALNTPMNEGMAIISANGRYLYFAACRQESGGCDLYEAGLGNEYELSNIQEVKGFLNTDRWDSQPSLTCDGEYIYFSSNRPGGFGGTDIWRSHRRTDGKWDEAINLGAEINTPGDEEAPHIARDGKTLYFASDGHPGFGEADIFMSQSLDATTWTKAVNMGKPINSPYREIGFTVNSTCNEAYFASAREGGLGGLDIYKIGLAWQQSPQQYIMLEGSVFAQNTAKPIENVLVQVSQSEKKFKKEVITDENGKFFICLVVDKGSPYSFVVNHTGFEIYVNAEYLKKEKDVPVKEVSIVLIPVGDVPKSTVLDPPAEVVKSFNSKTGTTSVYFDTDSHVLKEAERIKIEKILSQFAETDELTISVIGYADEIGDPQANIVLSERRARSVAEFLQDKKLIATIQHEGRGAIKGMDVSKNKKRRVEVTITTK